MERALVATTASAETSFLSTAELRLAAGLASGDSSQDTLLTLLGKAITSAIAQECGIVAADGSVATLFSEVLEETLWVEQCEAELILSRMFVSAVASVTVDGTALATTDYQVKKRAGILLRKNSTAIVTWAPSVVVVAYTAGFSTIPDDLKLAAMKAVGDAFTANGRDGNLRRVRVDGIGEREWRVDPDKDALLSLEAKSLLGPYLSPRVW